MQDLIGQIVGGYEAPLRREADSRVQPHFGDTEPDLERGVDVALTSGEFIAVIAAGKFLYSSATGEPVPDWVSAFIDGWRAAEDGNPSGFISSCYQAAMTRPDAEAWSELPRHSAVDPVAQMAVAVSAFARLMQLGKVATPPEFKAEVDRVEAELLAEYQARETALDAEAEAKEAAAAEAAETTVTGVDVPE